MADKKNISDMMDALLDDKGEEARVAFHTYAKEKMQEVIHGENSEEPTNKDDKNN